MGLPGTWPPDSWAKSYTRPSTRSAARPSALTNLIDRSSLISGSVRRNRRPGVDSSSQNQWGGAGSGLRAELARGCPLDHAVDDAVVTRLLGGEPAVAVGIRLDAIDGLAGVEGDALGHRPLQADDLLGLDGDIGGLALNPAVGLVHHDPGVG